MFEIDDNFLASVGYDIASMSDKRKQRYIDEFTQELGARISSRFIDELSDEQIAEFNDVQENHDRAVSWLNEFHADYREREDYRSIREGTGNAEDAESFYATALWMRDAIPNYGGLIQDEMNEYQAELVKMRQIADNTIASN